MNAVSEVTSRRPQQDELGAEARTHRHQQAVAAGRRRALAQRVLQDVQHRRRGQVADPGQRLPGELDSLARQLQRLLQRVDHLRPAGVADPPADVGAGQAVVGQEHVDVLAHVAPDHGRHLGVQHDPQAGAADVEAHGPLGVGVEPAAGVEHRRPGRRLVAIRPAATTARRRRRTARWRPGSAPRRRRAARSASTARRRRARRPRRGGRQVVVQPGDARRRRRRSRGRTAAPASRPAGARPGRRSARRGTARRARSPSPRRSGRRRSASGRRPSAHPAAPGRRARRRAR